MNHRILFTALFALIAAPVLAGCATNNNTGNDDEFVLTMGSMMPLTGELAGLGADMEAGAKLAVKQVNAASKGIEIEAFYEDDKTGDSAAAPGTFQRLVGRDIDVLVGPCCSGVTGSILDLAIQEGIVVATPSATSPKLTAERDNQGYFWRVPASDSGQGVVMARLLAKKGEKTVNMIIVNNAYGNGMADVIRATSLNLTGGTQPQILKIEKHDERGATDYSSQVTSVCAAPLPDALVLVTYTDNAAGILREMQKQDCLDKMRGKIYGSEGIFDTTLVEKAGTDSSGKFLAAGIEGTRPGGDPNQWNALFRAEFDRIPQTYSAESYDAVMYLALAALDAKVAKEKQTNNKVTEVSGEEISDSLLRIANPPGTKYSDFARAADAINAGDDIDWVGQAHDLEFTDLHEPAQGSFSYWRVKDDGTLEIYKTGELA